MVVSLTPGRTTLVALTFSTSALMNARPIIARVQSAPGVDAFVKLGLSRELCIETMSMNDETVIHHRLDSMAAVLNL
jgi:hypothetical protein